MATCQLHVRTTGADGRESRDHWLASCALPDGFLAGDGYGGVSSQEGVTLVVVDYERPVPEGLVTSELQFTTDSAELVRFGNNLLHGVGGNSEAKAAVVQIQGPNLKKRGYILPPSREMRLTAGVPLLIVVGVRKHRPVPVPVSSTSLKQEHPTESAEASPKRSKPRRQWPGSVPTDTPELSVARQREIEQLRWQMADLVESKGPLNTRTKTGRFVARDGYFKGLAAMYGRWVFGQKATEGEGPGLDPLLPSQAPVDAEQLPKELVEAGMHREAALEVSSALSELSCAAAERMTRLSTSPASSQAVRRAREGDGSVQLTYAGARVSVGGDHYYKLSNLWDLNVAGKEEARRDADIFCVLQRYESLSGASPGFQMALPEDVFDVLQKHWEVSHECFASPLNCYFPSYCSMFRDTDGSFGSRGSFFDFRPTEGSFEANPPFLEHTMTANVRHISDLLSATSLPLSFAVVVPGWDDDSCESYRLTVSSAYLTAHLVFDVKDHFYKNGMQHKMAGSNAKVYQPSSCSTFVFFLQNEAGAVRWPVKDAYVADLRRAFCSQSQQRCHQGHRDILVSASKSWYGDL